MLCSNTIGADVAVGIGGGWVSATVVQCAALSSSSAIAASMSADRFADLAKAVKRGRGDGARVSISIGSSIAICDEPGCSSGLCTSAMGSTLGSCNWTRPSGSRYAGTRPSVTSALSRRACVAAISDNPFRLAIYQPACGRMSHA